MKTSILRMGCAAITVAALTPLTGASIAQSAFPSKPLRVEVGATAGGGTDLVARMFAERMSSILAQTIIIKLD